MGQTTLHDVRVYLAMWLPYGSGYGKAVSDLDDVMMWVFCMFTETVWSVCGAREAPSVGRVCRVQYCTSVPDGEHTLPLLLRREGARERSLPQA